jgi:hypothetical protein
MKITEKQARKLVHAQRLEAVRLHGRQPERKHNMSAAERERLGVLWHLVCSKYGELHQWAMSYHIATKGGTFRTTYDPHFGTIFGRFEKPEGLRGTLFDTPFFHHHGKWNLHTSRGHSPEEVIASWERELRVAMEQGT